MHVILLQIFVGFTWRVWFEVNKDLHLMFTSVASYCICSASTATAAEAKHQQAKVCLNAQECVTVAHAIYI